MRRLAPLLLAAALAAAGCGGSKPAAGPSPSPSPFVLDGCVARGDAEVVHLTASDGQPITGAVYGSGAKGVVLGHMGAGNLCPWAPEAKALAGHGYATHCQDPYFGRSQSGGQGRELASAEGEP